ncbi:MAG: DEAD/DEAH box helicase [Opitutaceae bacterium]|nr:DEAD/DEAH box helicase [Opitutaceae bacterium]
MSNTGGSTERLRASLAGWLSSFDLATRAKGRTYYARGLVTYLQVDSVDTAPKVTARVHGSQVYHCTLSHALPRGWVGGCTCPVGSACKHLFATGSALLDHLRDEALGSSPASPPSVAPPTQPPVPREEVELVAQFTSLTGSAPDKKQLTWLRHLLRLFQSVQNAGAHYDFQSLQHLLPPSHRHGAFSFYTNPFNRRWAKPPDTVVEFWSHLALILVENNIPLPTFAAPLAHLDAARAAVAAHRREQEVEVWRGRFAAFDQSLATSTHHPPPPSLRQLRLRLAEKKPVWEVSTATGFTTLSVNELRDLLYHLDRTSQEFSPSSLPLVTLLHSRLNRSGRLALKLADEGDREFLGQLLCHPQCRDLVVSHDGKPLNRSDTRLTWQIRDHPQDPEMAFLLLADSAGVPAPSPLLHLGGRPSLYLHENTLFVGLPPPGLDPSAPVPIPRAALALPEAGRFAARAGVKLPHGMERQFQRETLQTRLRAWTASRSRAHPELHDDMLVLELAAINAEGTPRAIYDRGIWRRSGVDLPAGQDNQAFLILDFDPTRAAVDHFLSFSLLREYPYPDRSQYIAGSLAPSFPEIFSTWISGFSPDTRVELDPELAALVQPATRAEYTLALEPAGGDGIDWFDVRVTLRAEDTTLTAEELQILAAARGAFVRLPGRGWRRLAIDNAPALNAKLAKLGLDPASSAKGAHEPLRFHALQLADEALRDVIPDTIWSGVCARSASLRAVSPPAVPPGLAGNLRPYQHEGFQFLAFLSENRFGGILADDMGLGKTLQTLAWLLWLAGRRDPAAPPLRVLVVCPKSVVVNWQLETTRFAPELRATSFRPDLVETTPPVTGADEAQPTPPPGAAGPNPHPHLIVANYTQLRLHAELLSSVKWDAVILDEGQNIKNPASATAQAARALDTSHRLVLTGTPVENRLLDLWSLYAFAQPGLLGSQAAFKRLYHDKEDPVGAHQRLAQRVRHFLLRRTKQQVAQDLPPRIEEELVVELEGPQRKLYDAELKRTRAMLLGVKSAREFDQQRFNILQSLLRLRQICCDPRLLGVQSNRSPARKKPAGRAARSVVQDDAEAPTAGSASLSSAKLEALLDTVEPLIEEGHKVLVFSQFVTMLELIRDELVTRGIGHLMLTGQTENRQERVDRFQSDPTLPVFLLSLKAAGSGLNLTAASYVVLFDPWWNPAVEAQAIDRTHRIGQKNQVIAYRLLARDTVEEKIRALQKEKAALAAAVVQEESLASVLDLESLRRILS